MLPLLITIYSNCSNSISLRIKLKIKTTKQARAIKARLQKLRFLRNPKIFWKSLSINLLVRKTNLE
jgi:hypothetical protein